MSSIDQQTVRHVAHLARLNLTDEEIERMTVELSAILDYVRQLSELNTENVPPTAHAVAVSNVFRDDEVRPGLDTHEALRNAPQIHGDFFQVPKVLDQEEA